MRKIFNTNKDLLHNGKGFSFDGPETCYVYFYYVDDNGKIDHDKTLFCYIKYVYNDTFVTEKDELSIDVIKDTLCCIIEDYQMENLRRFDDLVKEVKDLYDKIGHDTESFVKSDVVLLDPKINWLINKINHYKHRNYSVETIVKSIVNNTFKLPDVIIKDIFDEPREYNFEKELEKRALELKK